MPASSPCLSLLVLPPLLAPEVGTPGNLVLVPKFLPSPLIRLIKSASPFALNLLEWGPSKLANFCTTATHQIFESDGKNNIRCESDPLWTPSDEVYTKTTVKPSSDDRSHTGVNVTQSTHLEDSRQAVMTDYTQVSMLHNLHIFRCLQGFYKNTIVVNKILAVNPIIL